MRSKKLAMAAATIMAALTLGACSGSSATDEAARTEAADAPVGGTIEYSWWGGPGRNDRTQAVIDLYQEGHPEVTVIGTTGEFNSYWQKASVQAAGKNLPCVPQMQNRTIADYSERRALLPLDDLVKSGAIDTSNIKDNVLDNGRGDDGRLYMIPYGVAFESLMVNVTQAKTLGLELPPEGYDWDWMAQWLKSASAKTGTPVTSLIGGRVNEFESWVRSHGDNLFQDGKLGFSKERLADYWEYSEDLRRSGASFSADKASETTGQAVEQSDFAKGSLMTYFWPANALGTVQATIAKAQPGTEIRAFPQPKGEAGFGNAFWASGLSISANCTNVATAASFINFFINDPTSSLAYASDNGANVHTKNVEALLSSPDITDQKKSELELYKYLADEGVRPAIYLQGYASIFNDMLNRHYQRIAFGENTIGQGVDEFFSEANGVLG